MPDVHGFAPETPPAVRRRVVAVLVVAVLGISSGAVLVRGMEGASPVAIAAWRTLGAAVLLSPGVARDFRGIAGRDLLAMLLAGAALAAHFTVWFASLELTTVLRSTVLVCLVPLWTGLLEWALGRRPPARFWLGLLIALPGIGLLTADAGTASLTGDLLALIGGILWAVYFAIGRSVRQRVGVAAYMGLVCFAATLPLWPLAIALDEPLTGFPPQTWLLLFALVIGPQLLGHQGSNYAVAYLPARVVAAVMLLEPVGAGYLAAIVLGEIPPLAAIAGGALVVAGIVTATLGRATGSR